mgnify:FL=1
MAYQTPPFRRVLPDLIAFAVGLGIAWILEWKTTDLVWSSWLSSLVLGYLAFLSAIGVGLSSWILFLVGTPSPTTGRQSVLWQSIASGLIGFSVLVFLLGFFSIHFCGFHAGQAIVLSGFFPLGIPETAFYNAFMNPLLLWKTVFPHLLPTYGIFLVSVIISERSVILAPILSAMDLKLERNRQRMAMHDIGERTGADRDRAEIAELERSSRESDAIVKDFANSSTIRPYGNVFRMQVLTFIFAFCGKLDMQSFVVYALVYRSGTHQA